MTTGEVADRLVQLSRQGNTQACYDELYSPEIMSIEPEGYLDKTTFEGMEAVMLKLQQVAARVKEVHNTKIGDPIVAGGHFALRWKTSLTYHDSTHPAVIDEIAVFEVKEGKIVKEQFFYQP